MKKIKSTFLLDGGINFYFPTNYENVRNMQHLRAVFLIHQIITVNQNEKEWAGVEWHHYGAKCFPSRAAFVECAMSLVHMYTPDKGEQITHPSEQPRCAALGS